MKITSSAAWSLKVAGEMVFPFVSGSLKSGAVVPSGSMVEGVSDMRKLLRPKCKSAKPKYLRYAIYDLRDWWAQLDTAPELQTAWGAAFTPLQRCQPQNQSFRSLAFGHRSGLKAAL